MTSFSRTGLLRAIVACLAAITAALTTIGQETGIRAAPMSARIAEAALDYDGDGIDDVLVGTRTGQIRMYKGTREAVEGKDLVAALKGTLSPAVLEFTQFVPVAGKEVFDVMSFVYPCDWNADGLFDLLLGSTQGKVFIALNQGSKAEPKFPKAEPVKGTDTEKDLAAPANWMNGIVRVYWNNFFGGYCNSALLWTAEKSVSLRAGSEPLRPVAGDTFLYFRYVNGYPGYTRNHLSWILPINRGASIDAVIGARVLSPNIRFRLKLKQQYELSFSSVVVGRPVAWDFWAHEKVKEATATEADQYKTQYASGMIAPSVGWQKRTFRFRCPSEVQASYDYNLYFRMPEGEVRFLLDDLSVKEIVR